jgi:2-C-methyl-D-erythritol 4-phosphate cytidylyltransferase
VAVQTVAVVLAGGTGARIGPDRPKQLLEVAGRTILEHSIACFDQVEGIDEVLVVMAPGFVAQAQAIVERAGFTRVRRVLAGGRTRSDSTRVALTALAALGPHERNVLLHDAARPLLEPRTVAACIEALTRHEAVMVAITSSDTIVVTEGDRVIGTPPREQLRRVQTPQGFRFSLIQRAYELAGCDPDFAATDDCGVVLKYLPDVPIHVVAGSERNMKITHPIDLVIADQLFRLTPGR